MNEQNYIQFDAYLSKTMSLEEAKSFEDKLKNDVEFKKAFKLYEELNSFLEHNIGDEEETDAFKTNLESVSDNYFKSKDSKTTKTIKFRPWKYAVAASIAIIFGVFMFNEFSTPTYNDFATVETISLTVRGEQQELLKSAETAFNSKNYSEADELFKTLLNTTPSNSEISFYRGITNIELGNYKVAESLLTELSNGNSIYKHKATWYMALSKLKQKDYNACLEVLKQIPSEAEDYKRAQKLIRKLK